MTGNTELPEAPAAPAVVKEESVISELCDALRIAEPAEVTPDWQCSFCSGLNPAGAELCLACRSSRLDSNQNFFSNVKIEEAADPEEPPANAESGSEEEEEGEGKSFFPHDLVQRTLESKEVRIGAAAAAACAVFGGLLWAALQSNGTDYRVVEARWERSIPLLRYQWVEREAWRDEVQGDDVQILSQRRMVRDYEDVAADPRPQGKGRGENKGDGESWVQVFESRPVYDIRIRYRSKQYMPFHTARVSGNDVEPRWPSVNQGTGIDGKPDILLQGRETYEVKLQKVDPEDAGPDWIRVSPSADEFADVYEPGAELAFELSKDKDAVSPLSPTAPVVAFGKGKMERNRGVQVSGGEERFGKH